MPDLRDLLGKFKDSLDSDLGQREKISEAVKGVCGFEIRLSDINLKNGVLRIETTGAKKSEIKLHQEEILSRLKTVGVKVQKLF